MDATTFVGESKEKLKIYIEQKNSNTTRIKLREYARAENLLDLLAGYENLKIKFYDFNLSLDANMDE